MQKQTREEQKGSKEYYFLIKALQCCDDIPKGEIEKLTHPDFRIIQDDGTRIGIEITEYVRSNLREGEATLEKIADIAKTLYESKSNPPLHVTFGCCSNLDVKGKNKEEVAAALVEVIINMLPSVGSNTKTVYTCDTGNPTVQNITPSIRICRLKENKSCRWCFDSAGFTPLSHEAIQGIINKKHGKLFSYRNHCDLVWLLIVAAGNRISLAIDTDWQSKLGICTYDSAT